MNAEAGRSSTSNSSSDEEENRRKFEGGISSKSDSYHETKREGYYNESGEETLSSISSSHTDPEFAEKESPKLTKIQQYPENNGGNTVLKNLDKKASSSSVPSSLSDDEYTQEVHDETDKKENRSESESSIKEGSHHGSSSVNSDSDRGLLQSILSDSSSEKIVTDIDVSSPKDGKFSSSTDEELLKKFREQQANRRYRPRSAKLRRDADHELENAQYIPPKADRRGSKSSSSSLSSDQEKSSSTRRKRDRSQRKPSSGSSDTSSIELKNRESPRSPSLSLSSQYREKFGRQINSSISSLHTASSKHEAKIEGDIDLIPTKNSLSKTSSESDTSNTLTTSATSVSPDTETTITQRPISRREKRPKSGHFLQKKTRTKTHTSIQEILTAKAAALPRSKTISKRPIEPGFPWPYNEDIKGGDRALRKLIEFHKRKLNNLLAQEYLQKHLELELRKAGTQFKEYEREPRLLSPKQVRKFREQNITWVYLDGRLYNLPGEMGSFHTRQRGRPTNKVLPNKEPQSIRIKSKDGALRSNKRSKRSVSFEKGSGRSSSRSTDKGKKNRNRRQISSGSSSRKSSLSSRSSAKTLSRSSSRTSEDRQKRSRSTSRERSASHDRSSSRSLKSSQASPKQGHIFKTEKKKPQERPKTAKRKSSRQNKSGSSVSSVERSSGKASSTNKKDKHLKTSYRSDEEPALQRVLFTEDLEKKMLQSRKNKRNSVRIAIAPGIYNTKQPVSSGDSSTIGRRGNRQHAQRNTRQPVDDYNFYRDHNIPGHAFPYYYLSYLLSMENGRRKNANNYVNRVVLKPAPVQTAPPWGIRPTKHKRSFPKPKTSRCGSPRSSRKKKTKSVIENKKNENVSRSSSRESASSPHSISSSSHTYPRIRPGSGPVRCSWRPNREESPPKCPGTDHQLKNTDNPEILAWLRRKDAQLHVRKKNEIRKQRKKTSRLIDEQNDREEKQERALRQYEMWKKTKDREILLRRRNEAMEANTAEFAKNVKDTKRKERPRTAPLPEHKSTNSTFSELRSSSASPNAEVTSKARKPRPKSATSTGVSFSDPISVKNPRPRSATPPRKGESEKAQSVFGKTENFFKSFLGIGAENKSPAPVESQQSESSAVKESDRVTPENRDAYEKWVRSSSPKAQTSKSSKRNRKNNQRLPPHNHSDNDLISNLAKRRIESILASRTRVDSGLRKRPSSGKNGIKNPRPPTGRRTDPPTRKWKLRDDDVIKPQVKSISNNSLADHSSSSVSSNSVEDRPKFSFSLRTNSKSTRHHRNPVVREALSRK